MHTPDAPASKPAILLYPRLIEMPVGCEVPDATGLPFHPRPVEYYLRPIRGRPRGSKTGGGKQKISSSLTDVVSDVTQLSDSSTQATRLEQAVSMTEKPKKTRAKNKKVVQPNPYPDLSKYRLSGEKSTFADDVTTHSPMTSAGSADSALNTALMGSPPMIHYPLPVSENTTVCVIANAERNSNVSRPSSTCSYTKTYSGNESDDHTPDEIAVTDRSLIYPAPAPPDISSTSTGSTSTSAKKRKRAADDNELHEMRSNAKRPAVNTPSSSPSELYDYQTGATSSTATARRINEHATPSGDGCSLLADTYRNTCAIVNTAGNAALSPVMEDSEARHDRYRLVE